MKKAAPSVRKLSPRWMCLGLPRRRRYATTPRLVERRLKVCMIALERNDSSAPRFASVRLIAAEYRRRNPDDHRVSDRQINRDLHAGGLTPMGRQAIAQRAIAMSLAARSRERRVRMIPFDGETWLAGD